MSIFSLNSHLEKGTENKSSIILSENISAIILSENKSAIILSENKSSIILSENKSAIILYLYMRPYHIHWLCQYLHLLPFLASAINH